ncbi:alpha/beta hydrolase-fold protein [Rhodohalobacter sp. 614A]|uniref:alpha/beta hydrolase-fold protein n=1 Tax=Rhodohalobacter sp. 614A TaxID=2908649 RepID=UPI001EEBA4D8|nr:alpha/beta hydrolase-fold protein [Rhodohalobacter sp. 614A]
MEDIHIGKKHSLYSKFLDEEREYWVHLPDSYEDTTYAPQDYPVLYVLDGDKQFHLLTGIQNFLSEGLYASIPEMIVVGILNTHRSRDFTPTHSKSHHPEIGGQFTFPDSGGGDTFLDFIEKELVPEINQNYRTNKYKIFVGHSFGGLLVLYTLLTRSNLFNAFISIDPSIWWDDYFVLDRSKQLLSEKNFEGKTLYLAQSPFGSSNRAPEESLEFRDQLQKNTINGLRWKFRYFEEENHGTIPLPAEHHGLRFIFDGYRTDVKTAAEDPEMVIDSFKKLSKKLGVKIHPPEYLVDGLGDFCLKYGETSNALKFFKINQEIYPESPHAFLQLGNYYSQTGAPEKAIQAYKQALELDSTYQPVIEKLKK